MCRVGYRHLLPPAQLILFGVLCLIAHRDRLGQQPCMYIDTYGDVAVFAQEGPDLPPFGIHAPCHEPTAQVIATCLNFPAIFVGLVIEETWLNRLLGSDTSFFFASAPAVLLLWYWIGRRIDRGLGYATLRKGRRSFPRVLAKLAFGCSVLILFLSAIVLRHIVLSHHRWDDVVVGSAMVGWSVFFMAVAWSNLRRSRARSPTEGYAQ